MMIFFWKHISTLLSLVLSILPIYIHGELAALPPPCDNRIFCHGPLLRTVQLADLGGDFVDSKYFVDMTLVHSQERTTEIFTKLMNDTHNNPSKSQVRQFVEDNFEPPNTEFTTWAPEDWIANPKFLKNVSDEDLRSWGSDLNEIWKDLGRKISPSVFHNPDKHSLIYVSHPFIVPGGRFRETYYWDSYWTIEGLLLSEMKSTVLGMLDNFFELVNTYGLIPNGNRIYYTRRSQPPYLIPMAKLYFDATNDKQFLRKNIKSLEKEFNFWETQRTIPVRAKSGKIHRIAQYNVEVGGPRPESYKEDYYLAQNLSTNDEREELYIQLKSGAESGWDYSTRWFVKGDPKKESIATSKMGKFIDTLGSWFSSFFPKENTDLSDINVTAIAPVDLNSLLCYNAQILSEMHFILGDDEKSAEYLNKVSDMNNTIADLFWDEKDGIWYDVNIHTGEKRKNFYLSNFHPIWSGCFGGEKNSNQKATMAKVIDYLIMEEIDEFIGGVPTSLKDSHQQWDYPNAWAPLQDLIIMGLYKNRHLNEEAEPIAFKMAQKWVSSAFDGYKKTREAHLKESTGTKGVMFEKYNVNILGIAGSGGEYPVVDGFGWTNGVTMKLLNTFGRTLTPTTTIGASSRVVCQPILILTIILVTSFLSAQFKIQ